MLAGCADKSDGVTITVSAARAAQCEQQGGCNFVSQVEVYGALNEAYALGAKSQAVQCGRKS